MKISITFLFLLLTLSSTYTQVPITELVLFSIRNEGNQYHVYSPRHLSAFNPGGYTNQPFFAKKDLIYASVQFPDSTQHDLFALDIANQKYYPLTRTTVNEFSPGFVPGTRNLSYIRQNTSSKEKDQQLFIYEEDEEEGISFPALSGKRDLGYYCWINSEEIALFLDQDIPKLAFANIPNQEFRIFGSNIGRCLQSNGDGLLYYVHKYTDDFWYLKAYDPVEKRSEILIQTLKGCEDFAIAPDGSFFQGSGSKLYSFHPGRDKEWKEVFDLSVFGIENISRMAINENFQLALVDVKSPAQ